MVVQILSGFTTGGIPTTDVQAFLGAEVLTGRLENVATALNDDTVVRYDTGTTLPAAGEKSRRFILT